MKMLTVSLMVVMLVGSGMAQAGLLQTVAEIPGRAVEATTTVVKDVVTAPGEVAKDVVTAPAKVLAPETVKTEEIVTVKEEEQQPNELMASAVIEEDEEVDDMSAPSKELAE